MTILPNKPKKNVSKGDRHTTAQSTNRMPALNHAHHHNVCPSSMADTRKPNGALSQSNKGNVPKASGIHSGGAASTESNKKQALRREDGRNSDDEYGEGFADNNSELLFKQRLHQVRGLHIKAVRGDGACLFRAVADQVYGDEEMHSDVRRLCLDYMAKNRDHFSQFVTEDFEEYLARKRRQDEHGNHVELQAISEIFSRPIEIYEYSTEPRNIFSPRGEPSNNAQPNPPIRLSYHGTVHYNSVFDPKEATIGVGLGLPGYAPGSADVNLMRDALLQSEMHLLEEAMLNDKINMTDYERTEQEISNQVARESYVEYVRNIETGDDRKAVSGGVKRSTSVVDGEPGCSQPPLSKMRSREHSQDTTEGGKPGQMKETEPKGALSFYEELIASSVSGGGEWGTTTDEDDQALLAQVMALSQQEFLESLIQRHANATHTDDAAEKAGSSKSFA